jgi:radical SAM superfamily enzyme YgiQ (UPF0313 family)
MLSYEEPVIRPPAEAESLILQATIGCSHNRCAFCVTYRQKRFHPRSREDLFAQIDWAGDHMPKVRRVFLGDGDPLVLSTDRLHEILDRLHDRLPQLRRVTAYASARNFEKKSVAELERLAKAGLTQVYVGLESGCDEILERIDKGVTHQQMVDLCEKPTAAGIKLSTMIVLGLGGPRLSERHAVDSARLVDRIGPRFASTLTLMLPPGARSYKEAFGDPQWRPLDPLETLKELRRFVSSVEGNGIIFRSNHVSNILALEGVFQKSKQRMIAEIDQIIGN